jgi:hypothetical protein
MIVTQHRQAVHLLSGLESVAKFLSQRLLIKRNGYKTEKSVRNRRKLSNTVGKGSQEEGRQVRDALR